MIKEKLMAAVKEAAANYNGGMSASESVAKAAEAADMTIEQAYRLTEMTNTLLTLNKEKDAEDPTGSCELASKDDVARILLGVGHEKAASAPLVNADYSFYESSPEKTNEAMKKRAEATSSFVKKAAADRDSERIPDGLDISQESLYAAIDKSISILKSAGDAADDVVRGIGVEVERGLAKIAKFAESPLTRDDAVDMFKAACGNEDVVKMACEYSGRLARSDGGKYSAMAVFQTTPDVDAMLKESEDISSNLAKVEEYSKKRDYFIGKVAEFKDKMREIVGLRAPKVEKRASLADMVKAPSGGDGSPFERANPVEPDPSVRAAMDVSSIMKKAGIEVDVSVSAPDGVEKAAAPLFFSISPDDAAKGLVGGASLEHEQERALNARRAMILSDLMTNDPIISEADPDTIAESYKTMVMSSPRVSLDKAQVRAFLRSAVNSVAVSPSDAKMLTDVEKGIALGSRLSSLSSLDSSIKDSNL